MKPKAANPGSEAYALATFTPSIATSSPSSSSSPSSLSTQTAIMISSPIPSNGSSSCIPNSKTMNGACPDYKQTDALSSSLSSTTSTSSSTSSSTNGHDTYHPTVSIPIPCNGNHAATNKYNGSSSSHFLSSNLNNNNSNNNNNNEMHYVDIVAESPSESVLTAFLDYSGEGHDAGLLASINSLRRQGQFCDIKLVVGDRELHAHRAILAVCSPYLFDFLTSVEESTEAQPIYKLKDISYIGFQYLLEFMYTGRLSVPLNDVPVVYGTAMLLKMDAATRACSDFLSRHLTASNCLGIRRFCRDNEFRHAIDDYIRGNMEAIMGSKSFFGLTDLQVEVVGLDESISDVMMERRLFSLVLDWAKNSLNDLKPKLVRLTEQVNVLYLNHDNTLMDCADVEDTVISSDDDIITDYRQLLRRRSKTKQPTGRKANSSQGLHAFHKFSLNPEEALSVADREWSIIATCTTSENAYLAIAVLDGQLIAVSAHVRPLQSAASESNGTNSAPDTPPANGTGNFCHDNSPITRKASIAPLEWMAKARCAMGCVVLNNELIVCGGYDRGECLNSVEAFNLKENVWRELTPMNASRGRFGAAVHDGSVFTCGGSDGFRELSCVEKYDSSTQKWTPMASMLKERSSHGVATLNGKLYSIGGCEGQRSISCCEVYDPATNKWTGIASLNVARSQTSVCAYNGQLYAIGGTDLWNTLNAVEIYNPELNTWTLSSNLNIARRGAAVEVVNGIMVVAGGSDGTQSLTSSEIFDCDSNTWSMGPQMTTARANLSVVTIGPRLFAVGGFSGKKFLSSLEWLDLEGMEWLVHAPRLTENGASQAKENLDEESSSSSAGEEVIN